MSKSRYANTPLMQDKTIGEPVHYATWNPPSTMKGYGQRDLPQGEQFYTHTWQFGDRMDKLSSRYMGDDVYDWIICLVNNISDPFSITPGTQIKVPTDASPILEKLGLM